jgi:hypothetical protein
VGKWIDDKKEGEGIFYWKNGDCYIGTWKNNQIWGVGTMNFQENNAEHKFKANVNKLIMMK